MRLIIDVKQAPGNSYFHLADVDAVENAILGLCIDGDAQVDVQVLAEDGEDTTTIQFV